MFVEWCVYHNSSDDTCADPPEPEGPRGRGWVSPSTNRGAKVRSSQNKLWQQTRWCPYTVWVW